MTSTLDLACKHYAMQSTGIDVTNVKAPSTEDVELYTAAMLVCCAASGELHEKEEEWIVGHQAAFGAPDSIIQNIEGLKTKWTYEEILSKMKESPTLKSTRRFFVFHCISACDADGVLDPMEIESIRGVSGALDLQSDHFDEILALYKQQQELNNKLMKCLWTDNNPYE
uniref:Co-chaperone DjlA N-terminal domain-containing protein n=1 Tax=Helicotheca tamesis TaxID=374047 RepID=A0A7S2HZ79_9STRA|mmetsp:Transcript_419/g.522  ORF Transcript_419/g.522 Transcript_419/m.522 type:complete len:169 (+) Transcript_419:308-814(+)|eukprot:CAMPEP_0185726700 /NCGR_PEP_ID=MMETSP1171-20130828/2591_1 /TAXON_ID=374046 /ORGANISM="Helicotheca tamensis, Strain CCMP826" /LENGTH=168 /DNA_ID=CAMNT_0028395095 /DNA_START=222 /DNA_END=728 /DNA_ORIENTATION=-